MKFPFFLKGIVDLRYRELGHTGITVSRLCFGGLTVGPLQANLSLAKGSAVMRRAFEQGVNFIDTAQQYETYPYIREAIRGDFKHTVISSKSYDYTYQGMRDSLEEALRAIDRDYIDIFLLHEQESAMTIKGHWEAVEYLIRAKEKGMIRAAGISTHHVAAVRAAAMIPELDVIHPLINKYGIGIQDGSAGDMLEAVNFAHLMGKGIYGMKALGGGHLIKKNTEALDFVLGIEALAAVAVGMQRIDEVDFNVNYFSGRPVADSLKASLAQRRRHLHIEDYCRGCGRCVEKCSAGALVLVEGRAQVNDALCRLCGYCAAVCPEFCIKII